MTVLTCDKCDTQFEVPETALVGGRKVRCTNCMHVWFQPDPNVADVQIDMDDAKEDTGSSFADIIERNDTNNDDYQAAEPVPESFRPADSTDNKVTITEDEETKKISTMKAITIFIAMFLITLIVILAAQKSLVSSFPQTAALYEAVGIKATPVWEGLKIQEGISIIRPMNGQDMLYIEATVVNISDEDKRVPPVRVDLTDIDTGDVLQTWRPDMARITLSPGEKHQIKLGFTDTRYKVGKIKIYFRDFD